MQSPEITALNRILIRRTLTPVLITLCMLCLSTLVHGESDKHWVDPAVDPDWRHVWSTLFWTTPVFLVLQVGALLALSWRVLCRWSPHRLGAKWPGRLLLLLGVVIAPLVMLFFSSAFAAAYQEQRGHWFFSLHDGMAGLALIPFYAVGSVIVGRGIVNRDFRLRSGTHLVVLWTLTGICLWYAFATAFLDMSSDALLKDMSLAAIVPALAAGNYALLATDILRHGRPRDASSRAVVAWFAALGLTIAVKIPIAIRFFSSLPVEAPAGYGDCFVVSAAAQGHSGFVGSHFDPQLGRTVNGQWRTLRRFEDHLARRQPGMHRRLRQLYNQVGPPVAARIRSPLAADVVYVLLKPIEWVARLYLTICSSR